jgi:UDP-2-acetamido-3-amino-2,3-dideoxy-glucuronate N-acetyltransferase
MGWVSKYGHRLQFDETGRAGCPESGAIYQLEAETVSEIN